MPNYQALEARLTELLRLSRRPVAIAFRDRPPTDLSPVAGTQPSGCSFWRLASEGHAFYTVASDHYNCPIGSYTHNIPLPSEQQAQLSSTLSLMVDVGYLRMEEVPAIQRLPATPTVVIYAPLSSTPVEPDVVLLAGAPGQLMLLHEAAARAAKTTPPLLGRPTCMAIPAALSGGAVTSLGCIGNRVYTGISDDELYTVIAGRDLGAIAAELETITSANAVLREYHRGRLASLASA